MEIFEYKKKDAQGNENERVHVFYERTGSGPAVMLLHGWGCNHTFWHPIAKVLARSYTVYNFDLPGFGQSDEPMTAWGVNEYVEMLEAFVAEHCPGPVSLVGHSFGGRMSIIYASRNPVTRIALVDAAGIRPKRTLGYYRRVYTYKFKRWLVLHVFRRPVHVRWVIGIRGYTRKRIVLDCWRLSKKANLNQTAAIHKRSISNTCNTRWNDNACQRTAVSKSTVSNTRNTRRNCDVSHRIAVDESRFTDARHTF